MGTRRAPRAAAALAGAALCVPLALELAPLAAEVAHRAEAAARADAAVEEFAPTASAEGGAEPLADGVDWEGLLAENPDAVAWVRAPGTRVDYAVVQAPASDPQRYLAVDLYGEPSYRGCPYVGADCAAEGGLRSAFAIVYGHHLVDGSMFSDFAKYSDRAYAEAHREVWLLTPEGAERLRVVAANVVDARSEDLGVGLEGAELDEYMRRKLAESEVVLEEPERFERVVCFATCSYQTDHSRTLVYAVGEGGR